MEENKDFIIRLEEHIRNDDADRLRALCEDTHPHAFAEILSELEPNKIWPILRHLDARQRVEIFTNLDEDLQVELAGLLRREELGRLVADMPPDDRVDLLKQMPEERQDALLSAIAWAEREDIKRLAAYPEGTAGSLMTTEYATVQPDMTVREAIQKIRLEAPDKETIYYAYVIDSSRKLIGFVSLKDLILANPESKVSDITRHDVISVVVDEDQEKAAHKVQDYDLIALPVIDSSGALVGIITHDDAFDVITQEQTEDMEKLMAIGGKHEAAAYMKTSVWEHFKSRWLWIFALAILGVVSGFIVQSYERLLVEFAILATFMPMLADTGGNTGSQSATLVVRALALGEITKGDAIKVILKEICVAIPLAILVATFAFIRVFLFADKSGMPPDVSPLLVGIAVGTAFTIQIVTSTLIGAALPLFAARLKFDPAVVASPAITTVVDITGLLIFFSTTRFFLGV